MRTNLSPGTVLILNGESATRKVNIERVIGEGASCIVYDAFFADTPGVKERCRVKECYPLDAKIQRCGDQLIWLKAFERSAAQDRFRKVREVSVELHNNPEVGNQIIKSGYYQGGENCYLIMDIHHGQTLDKENSHDLHRVLKIMLKLTQLVGKLHDMGYRYLDLKPDNILVTADSDPDIRLFDFDSLIPLDGVRSISYSRGWAAPELVQGQFSSLCNATDLYSIGAILFQKVMGRSVCNDDIGLFADWEFVGEMFEDVNPTVQRYLREIFRKTLSASVKRRYQNANALIISLKNACQITAEGRPFLISPKLQVPAHFVGREAEIQLIHQEFNKNKRALFLHGVGGIGKSSLAIAYAVRFQKEYDTVLFFRYQDSLEDLLDDIDVQNFNGTDKEKRRLLKRLLDKNTLLIIDNFDVSTDKDPFLWELLKFNTKILFTTRTDFRNVLTDDTEQIEVSALPYKQLETMFTRISGLQMDASEKQDTLQRLLKSIDYHTYVTDLLARQIVSSGWSLDTLARKMEDGLSGLATAEKVQTLKDGMAPKQTIPEGLRVLFNLADLDDHSKQILRNLFLLCGFVVVTKDTYKLFCASTRYSGERYNDDSSLRWYHFNPDVPESSADIDVLNELCECGWVQEKCYLYTLHPLVAELVHFDLMPCRDNCAKLYEYMNAILLPFAFFSEDDEADAREHRDHFELLCAFFKHIDFCDSINRALALKFIQGSIDTSDTPVEWLSEPEYVYVIEKLAAAVKTQQAAMGEIFEVYLVLFLLSMRVFHEHTESAMRESKVLSSYNLAFQAAKQLPPDCSEKAITRIHDEISWHLEQQNRLPKSFIYHIYDTYPNLVNMVPYYVKEYYEIPLTQQDQDEADREAEKHAKLDCSKKSDADLDWDTHLETWENQINHMYEAFQNSPNKLAFAQTLYEDSSLEVFRVVACLLEFCERQFDRISIRWNRWNYNSERIASFIQNTDWVGVEAVMDFASQLQKTTEWHRKYDGYSLYDDCFEPYRSSICDDHLWRIQLAAARNDWASFNQLMEQGVWTKNDVDAQYNLDPLWEIARVCWNLGKCHHILPYLIQSFADDESDRNFNERESISKLESIVEFAKKSCVEVEEASAYFNEYLQIAKDFTDRINAITGKSYTLKKDIDESSTKV